MAKAKVKSDVSAILVWMNKKYELKCSGNNSTIGCLPSDWTTIKPLI